MGLVLMALLLFLVLLCLIRMVLVPKGSKPPPAPASLESFHVTYLSPSGEHASSTLLDGDAPGHTARARAPDEALAPAYYHTGISTSSGSPPKKSSSLSRRERPNSTQRLLPSDAEKEEPAIVYGSDAMKLPDSPGSSNSLLSSADEKSGPPIAADRSSLASSDAPERDRAGDSLAHVPVGDEHIERV